MALNRPSNFSRTVAAPLTATLLVVCAAVGCSTLPPASEGLAGSAALQSPQQVAAAGSATAGNAAAPLSNATVRGQTPQADYWSGQYQYQPPGGAANTQANSPTPGSGNYLRRPMAVAGQAAPAAGPQPQVSATRPPGYVAAPAGAASYPPTNGLPTNTQANDGQPPRGVSQPVAPPFGGPAIGAAPGGGFLQETVPYGNPPIQSDFLPPPDLTTAPTTDVDVYVQETRTGRFMFGVGVNSDAGVTGQIVIDERNFDITRIPTGFDELLNGTGFRGGGQGLRIEAVPGNQVQRYLVNFTEPYLFGFMPISFNLSGFLYSRRFEGWTEQRDGVKTSLGYRLTHDLSLAVTGGAQQVKVYNPRSLASPELNAALGNNDLYTGRVALIHDTRDLPFSPTEGHYIELAYEQGFGDYDYPRGEFDYRKYFLMRERPDGSGRHTLSFSYLFGVSGSQTPIFENYFAGGFSTMRGFDFRGASPVINGVTVGGRLQFLGSVQYMFPLTADDMLKGVVFVDYGTVEQNLKIVGRDFRVAPGLGLRISVPALGPAPLAFDFSFPVAYADTDDRQIFSFFFGFGRM